VQSEIQVHSVIHKHAPQTKLQIRRFTAPMIHIKEFNQIIAASGIMTSNRKFINK
jgi:hypothetical protein